MIGTRRFADVHQVQQQLDPWRDIYNLQRPHEAIGMQPPAARYRPSTREFPATLPPIEYGPGDIVRKVQKDGTIEHKCQRFIISKAFVGNPVALRPTDIDGEFEVFFCHMKVARIELKSQSED